MRKTLRLVQANALVRLLTLRKTPPGAACRAGWGGEALTQLASVALSLPDGEPGQERDAHSALPSALSCVLQRRRVLRGGMPPGPFRQLSKRRAVPRVRATQLLIHTEKLKRGTSGWLRTNVWWEVSPARLAPFVAPPEALNPAHKRGCCRLLRKLCHSDSTRLVFGGKQVSLGVFAGAAQEAFKIRLGLFVG